MANYDKNAQRQILHGNYMPLEIFARCLFGERYFGSVNWTKLSDWKPFYSKCVEVLAASALPSIGAIDERHRNDIKTTIERLQADLMKSKTKDRVHVVLILGLFKLVFLLLGRLPYKARGAQRDLNRFRTLTYSQTDEQLSWLLQGHIQMNAQQYGFSDSFEADYAYFAWTKQNKRRHADRSAYVQWVRENLPEVLLAYK